MYMQALAYSKPKEHDGLFSTEPCVTLSYSELEANSEPCEIYVMDNFIQNHV